MKKKFQLLSPKEISAALAKTPFFAGLDSASLDDLSAQFTPFFIESGAVLLEEEDEGDSLFLSVLGRLRAFKNFNKPNEQVIGEITGGQLIGEIAMLTGEHRSLTVIALRHSVLLRLSKAAFLRFVEDHPLQLLNIAKHSILRLINPPKLQKNNITTIVVLPAGQDTASYRHFAKRLTLALAKVAPTLHVSYGSLADSMKEDESLALNWLNEQENNYSYIVYEADPKYSFWTEICIRQADQILTVSLANMNSTFNVIEDKIYSQKGRVQKSVELILVHPDYRIALGPTTTPGWLATRNLQLHHHIRENSTDDYDHLARYLTRQSVGLVLGGGGARSLAHIGVYRAIRECGIPIDMIAGVSGGALIGALIAQGRSWQEIAVLTREHLANSRGLFDYTFPYISLLRGKTWGKGLMAVYGEHGNIEDTWLPFFCVSTNISTNQLCVHQRGSLWKSIRASVSFPGIVPPISTEEGDLLIDGGVLNNMPVDLLQEFIKGGKIFAVSVLEMSEMHSPLLGAGEFSGWNYLLHRLRLSHINNMESIPSLAEIVNRSMKIATAQHELLMLQQADWAIQVPVQQYGLFDFHKIDELIEIGYQYAMKKLEKKRVNAILEPD